MLARVLATFCALTLVGCGAALPTSRAPIASVNGALASGPVTSSPGFEPMPRPAMRPRPAPIAEPPPVEEPAPDTSDPVRPDLANGLVVTGTTSHRLVLFTFDDGPHPRQTLRLLDALDAAGVRAVFFVTASRVSGSGRAARENAELLRAVVARGHVIGSHGFDHVFLNRLPPDEVDAQIAGAEEAIERAIGARPWLFRPPGGARSAHSDATLAARGYTQFLWNLVTGDFETQDPAAVLARFVRTMRGREARGLPGGVVLLHDLHPWSVDAFQRMIGWLEARKCELLAAGEELYDVIDDPGLVFPARPEGGDVSAVAPPAEPPVEVLRARQARLRARTAERCPH